MNDLPDNSTQTLDPSAWVDRHGDRLFRYALSRLRGPEAAEEAVQDTLVAALGSMGQYAGKGSEAAWLMGILKRKIVDCVRQRNRAVPVSDLEAADDLSETLFDHQGNWRVDPRVFGARPEELLQRDEFWEIFRICLAALPQRQADVFTLREVDGVSSEEICKVLEISASNLWVLLYRARLRLARCLKSHGQQEGDAEDA